LLNQKSRYLCGTFGAYPFGLCVFSPNQVIDFPVYFGQPGRPGAHVGIGIAPLAVWWLATTRLEDGVIEAAAAPARTTESAKMRIAVFIVSAWFFQVWLSCRLPRLTDHPVYFGSASFISLSLSGSFTLMPPRG
jgi:hypothetical protein